MNADRNSRKHGTLAGYMPGFESRVNLNGDSAVISCSDPIYTTLYREEIHRHLIQNCLMAQTSLCLDASWKVLNDNIRNSSFWASNQICQYTSVLWSRLAICNLLSRMLPAALGSLFRSKSVNTPAHHLQLYSVVGRDVTRPPQQYLASHTRHPVRCSHED